MWYLYCLMLDNQYYVDRTTQKLAFIFLVWHWNIQLSFQGENQQQVKFNRCVLSTPHTHCKWYPNALWNVHLHTFSLWWRLIHLGTDGYNTLIIRGAEYCYSKSSIHNVSFHCCHSVNGVNGAKGWQMKWTFTVQLEVLLLFFLERPPTRHST